MPLKVKTVESGFMSGGKFSPAARGNSARNPLPVGRFMPARVRRLASGDVQLLLEQTNPKRKKLATKKKAKKRTVAKRTTKRRPMARKSKRSVKKSKR